MYIRRKFHSNFSFIDQLIDCEKNYLLEIAKCEIDKICLSLLVPKGKIYFFEILFNGQSIANNLIFKKFILMLSIVNFGTSSF